MAIRHGYVPMHPPQKEVSHEDMLRILAKHSPPRLKEPLQWDKPVKTGPLSAYILSRCGSYSISKDVSGDSVTYTAWRRAPTRDHVAENLGVATTAELAKQMCEEDRGP